MVMKLLFLQLFIICDKNTGMAPDISDKKTTLFSSFIYFMISLSVFWAWIKFTFLSCSVYCVFDKIVIDRIGI